jgi:hypothetical protein
VASKSTQECDREGGRSARKEHADFIEQRRLHRARAARWPTLDPHVRSPAPERVGCQGWYHTADRF